jgi:hypothetical protein
MEQFMDGPKRRSKNKTNQHCEITFLKAHEMLRRAVIFCAVFHGCWTVDDVEASSRARKDAVPMPKPGFDPASMLDAPAPPFFLLKGIVITARKKRLPKGLSLDFVRWACKTAFTGHPS